ncbi:MAG: hypothetical protein B1H09_06940 [Gemmatimonadaceae bacterium 4484_173]|jgi:hypothetical protein|nr:MAG: hypothetical protein B1H09_06940 [Gemmatimonadaceae bacterium 4484_173]RKZ05059.1 MAG: hypothetical protein DRQ21_00880 [Candidatus Fermentibacteria bacterium]
MNWTVIGIWLGALLSLSLYSFLYKDNPFYKFAEHLFVGMSAGYWVIYTIMNVLIPNWWNNLVPAEGGMQPIWLIPGVLGLFMVLRVVPKLSGLSRFSLALIVGTGAGLSMTAMFQTNALAQVNGTIIALGQGGGWFDWVSNLILVAGVVCGLVYFFFSKAHTGVIGGAANVGITLLMVAFGASFGYTVMARISLLIGQTQFLLFDWLPTMGIHL